jgi:hypothetical protein
MLHMVMVAVQVWVWVGFGPVEGRGRGVGDEREMALLTELRAFQLETGMEVGMSVRLWWLERWRHGILGQAGRSRGGCQEMAFATGASPKDNDLATTSPEGVQRVTLAGP